MSDIGEYNKKGALNIDGAYPSQCIEEITELRTKLAMAEAALEVKNKALGVFPESARQCLKAAGYDGLVDWIDTMKEALSIQPSPLLLNVYLMNRLEVRAWAGDSPMVVSDDWSNLYDPIHSEYPIPLYKIKV